MGGYYPLVNHHKVKKFRDFAYGKAFTSGVFLALSLTVMLPSAFDLWHQILENVQYPVATYIAIGTFIILLGLEHRLDHIKQEYEQTSTIIPIIMTIMISISAFFMGTALGVSNIVAAIMVFLAIMVHKGSAAFALALTMVKSRMTTLQAYLWFIIFALATPLGIILGSLVHQWFASANILLFKTIIISIASGVFLYLGTTHGLRHTPFVIHCHTSKGFLAMLAGLLMTVAVSMLLAYASNIQA